MVLSPLLNLFLPCALLVMVEYCFQAFWYYVVVILYLNLCE